MTYIKGKLRRGSSRASANMCMRMVTIMRESGRQIKNMDLEYFKMWKKGKNMKETGITV